MTREQVEAFIATQIGNAERGECNPWAICEEDKIIGTCSILEVDEGAKSCEIGFALREDRWGLGIMTTVANRMIEFIDHELGMREIVAECEAENATCIRLLKRLGLVRVEIKENEIEREGGDARYLGLQADPKIVCSEDNMLSSERDMLLDLFTNFVPQRHH